ncbi:hypothetical protein L9Z17_12210 [Leptospira noguchii]|nr:hypothetical protein [Leptospira noguchii]
MIRYNAKEICEGTKAERSLELSVSLLWIARQIALNSAERSLWIAFYIETKEDYYIMFCVCNLLTRTENSFQLSVQAGFLTSNSRYLTRNYNWSSHVF